MNRRYGGTGLGLSISKKLVEMMNGSIGLVSEPNQGAEFWFSIPLELASDIPSKSTPKQKPEIPKPTDSEKYWVLVAEDNRVNQIVTRAQLESMGLGVRVVANGREAVQSFEQFPCDLILMDCQMPEMDGFEATRLIRSMQTNLGKRVPILALTANAIKGDEEACFKAGMDGYLTKPIGQEQLREAVARLLSANVRPTDG